GPYSSTYRDPWRFPSRVTTRSSEGSRSDRIPHFKTGNRKRPELRLGALLHVLEATVETGRRPQRAGGSPCDRRSGASQRLAKGSKAVAKASLIRSPGRKGQKPQAKVVAKSGAKPDSQARPQARIIRLPSSMAAPA